MHNIDYWSMDEKCDRKDVLCDIQEIARRDGDGYYGPLKWHDEVSPLKNREEAEKWIRDHDKGWYDDHAVRYYDYSKAKDTKKIADLKKRETEMIGRIDAFQKEHSVRNFKADYIGCSTCGSKISRKHLHGERCPVCGKDLRSESVMKKLKALYDKRDEIGKKIKEEKEAQTGSRVVRWLVKFEYHS